MFSSPDVVGVLAASGVFAFADIFAVPWFHAATVVVPDVALSVLLSCPDPAVVDVPATVEVIFFC